MTTRTFGVELEVHLPEGKTRAQLADKIRRAAGVRAVCEHYNHTTRLHWKLTTDASLEGRGSGYDTSAEVVSPVLSGEEGIAEARKVVKAIAEFGCTVSTRCGLHVHVFAGDFSVDQMRALAINFVHCETAFDAIVPPSRRRDNNLYVKSNRTAFGGNYDNDAINRAIDAYSGARTMEALIESVSQTRPVWSGAYRSDNRFRKLNLQAFYRYRTVEFRQHSGTVDADKVENWVRLCVAFVERSKTSKPRKRPSQKPHAPSAELAILLKFLKATPEMRAFFRERHKTLTRPTTELSPAEARLARARG